MKKIFTLKWLLVQCHSRDNHNHKQDTPGYHYLQSSPVLFRQNAQCKKTPKTKRLVTISQMQQNTHVNKSSNIHLMGYKVSDGI